ncbi:unnamed protein product [Linum trigynum]|uniref:Endonuclease/exonuclease/phosphatase domain-containing protein n=1 Tax=Linum trigynum TaxID=586398 RepID=A0AAV2G775_9ROSI
MVCKRREQRSEEIFLSAVYGRPNSAGRQDLWAQIRSLRTSTRGPWLLAGDFHSILSPQDRKGGAQFQVARTRAFRSCVDDSGLIDVGFSGPRYTWKRGNLFQRLDRALSNKQWLTSFPNTDVRHLERMGSDHRPILVSAELSVQRGRNARLFRFLAPWIAHEDFGRIMQESWQGGMVLPQAL